MKVLIVDDEAVVRIGLKSIINWETNGFELVGEAANGKTALRITAEQHPEIVITDIKMPVMDGLEYLRQLQGLPQKPTVVVLSGFNDFDLVKEAMRLGAADYLLKLKMGPDDFLQVLQKIRRQIEESRTEAAAARFLNRQVRNNLPLLRRNFLRDLISNPEVDQNELTAALKFLEVKLNLAATLCIGVKIGDLSRFEDMPEEELSLLNASIINILEEIINDDFNGHCIQGKTGEFYLLFSPKPDFAGERLREALVGTGRRIIEMLQQYVNIAAALGISAADSGTAGVRETYRQAAAALDYRFLKRKDRVVFWDEVSSLQPDNQAYTFLNFKDQILRALSLRRENELRQICDVIRRKMETMTLSREKTGNLALELFFIIYEFFERYQINLEEVLATSFRQPQQLIQMGDPAGLEEWLGRLEEDLVLFINKELAADYPRMIAKAKSYIEEHYSQGITLKEVAKIVNLNSSYFSTIFKQYVGISYTDYLTQVRVESGKRLLRDTESKIYEISKLLGYQNDYYFNRIFKKMTGMTPLEYRNAIKR